MKNTLLKVIQFFFPASCAVCKKNLLDTDEIRLGLCQNCKESIKPIEGEKCKICGKPLISEIDTCLPCRENNTRSYDRLWTLYPYTGNYRKLLASYKFHKNLSLGAFFASNIICLINENPILKDAQIIPVPPRPGKIKDTGWDQVDCLMNMLKKSGVEQPVNRCLKRSKSKVQKNLNRQERLENLKGKIYLEGESPKNVLIIDDVITTGSTMEVCASVLKHGGAQKVYGLCLFYD
ncbi:MAG: ComF family protein [Treponema sp.]|nr:ComF family protein [Treponema sp.]MCL2236741.1 ComF family protein [Treponema sp.]